MKRKNKVRLITGVMVSGSFGAMLMGWLLFSAQRRPSVPFSGELNLEILREEVLISQSAQELETNLNKPLALTHVDLNEDGENDYLSVQETWENEYTQRLAIYARANELAVIDIAYLTPHNLGFYIYGNEAFFQNDTPYLFEEIDFDELDWNAPATKLRFGHFKTNGPKGSYKNTPPYRPLRPMIFEKHRPTPTNLLPASIKP